MAHATTASGTESTQQTGAGSRSRVPVDGRLGGLERRSLKPALVVVGIWLLWAVALPHLDGAVEHDDQVEAGERFAISDDLAVPHHRGGRSSTVSAPPTCRP